MKPTTIEGVEIYQLDDHFIKTIYPNNSLINVHRLELMREGYTQIYGNEDLSQLKLMVIFEGEIEISIDLSERYLNGKIRKKKGEALVSPSSKTREYLNGGSALMGKTHPVKVFDTEKEAQEWLDSL